jgi:hypothetical protein
MKRAYLWYAIPVLFGTSAPALAAPTEALIAAGTFDGLTTVEDKELADQRGAFVWEGTQISLGADIKTYLNGVLVLRTTLNWTDGANVTNQYVSDALTPADAAAVRATMQLAGGATSLFNGGAQVYFANEGQTALLQRTDGSIANVLINTASGIDAVQQIDATIDLSGFQAFQSNLASNLFASAVGDQLAAATSLALGQ